MSQRRTRMRIIIKCSVLLLLGAALTVFAAWGSAVGYSFYAEDGRERPQALTAGELRWWKEMVSPSTEDEPEVMTGARSCFGGDLTLMSGSLPPNQLWSDAVAFRWRFGFPVRSMRFDVFHSHTFSEMWEWKRSPNRTITLYRNGKEHVISLPLTPIWFGFTVDTLFYATALGLALGGWRWMVRQRRLRRGLCPACTYPIGTSAVCTECGEALPAMTATSS